MASPSRSAVIAFGRFNPPTSGHKLLFDGAMSAARRLNADLIVYPSVSHDTRSNPLSFAVKVKFLQKLFPQITFNTNASIRTPFDAFQDIASRGYSKLYVVMGGDERTHEFQEFKRYFKQPTARDYDPSKHIPLGYQVISIPRQNQRTVSGTAQRARAAQNDFVAFLRGSADPKRPDIIQDLFTQVRQGMGMSMHESTKLHHAVARHNFRLTIVEQLQKGTALQVEAEGSVKAPSEVDRLKTRQNQEKIELQRRQSNELLSAKLRDVQQKSQEQQRKASAPKPAATKPTSR